MHQRFENQSFRGFILGGSFMLSEKRPLSIVNVLAIVHCGKEG
jgi:hypothetical protein